MVTTRGHPADFPEPQLHGRSPPKSATPRARPRSSVSGDKWAHTPTTITLVWLFVSLPLVLWDTGFVLLRPLSMPGGALHWPFWVPYELYSRTDYIYGWKAYNEKNGFTAAQATLNIIETLMYCLYLRIVYTQGVRLKTLNGAKSWIWSPRYVAELPGAFATLIGFAAAVMTLSKTILYGLNESYSGWSNVGHNALLNLVFLWILPNGAWIVFPAYMTVTFASEILDGLCQAAHVKKGLFLMKAA